MDYEQLLINAHVQAQLAADAEEQRDGHNWFPCGFAWVTIPGTSPLALHCRKTIKNMGQSGKITLAINSYGDKGYPKGWQFWCPGHRRTQSMVTYEAGAKAFAKVLTDAGLEATTGSRID